MIKARIPWSTTVKIIGERGWILWRSAVLGDVPLRVLVPERDPRVVPGLVGQELHRDVVAGLQVGVVAEVEEVLAWIS